MSLGIHAPTGQEAAWRVGNIGTYSCRTYIRYSLPAFAGCWATFSQFAIPDFSVVML